ncbi:c-type cytochrome [Nonomuraea sp. NPDC004186]
MINGYGCASCHTVPGVRDAQGLVGPPLASSAPTYIAGVLVNTPSNLQRWIRYPQAVEPGTAMPDLGVTEQDARDIAAYLLSLERDRCDCGCPTYVRTRAVLAIPVAVLVLVAALTATARRPFSPVPDGRAAAAAPPEADPLARGKNAITAYVASLGSGPPIPTVGKGDPRRGRTLCLASCASCHSSTAAGATMTGDVFAPSLLQSSPTQVAEAVRLGPGAMPPFPAGRPSSRKGAVATPDAICRAGVWAIRLRSACRWPLGGLRRWEGCSGGRSQGSGRATRRSCRGRPVTGGRFGERVAVERGLVEPEEVLAHPGEVVADGVAVERRARFGEVGFVTTEGRGVLLGPVVALRSSAPFRMTSRGCW